MAIVGPTASGKSALALALARHDAARTIELVSVDAMQVYRGMDVGTAKPTPAEQREVRHHLIDLADPSEEVTVVRFAQAAAVALDGIARRGHHAVLVGGTGLYLRALVDGLDPPPSWPEIRARLEADPDTAGLHARLAVLDPLAATKMEPTNRRRVVRALEVCLGSGRPFSSFGPGLETYPPTPTRQVGLRWPRAELTERIRRRYEAQLAAGFLDEVRAVAERGLGRTAAQALGYRELLAHLRGACSLEAAVDEAVSRTRRFAVRQERWFRRDPRIVWVDVRTNPLEALPTVLEAWGACCT